MPGRFRSIERQGRANRSPNMHLAANLSSRGSVEQPARGDPRHSRWKTFFVTANEEERPSSSKGGARRSEHELEVGEIDGTVSQKIGASP